MNHEELLEVLNQPLNKVYANRYLQVEFLQSALRAVVELHKPYVHPSLYSETPMLLCSECTLGGAKHEHYPCPTIRAIQEQPK